MLPTIMPVKLDRIIPYPSKNITKNAATAATTKFTMPTMEALDASWRSLWRLILSPALNIKIRITILETNEIIDKRLDCGTKLKTGINNMPNSISHAM
jgi:hypothetical protein